MSGEFQECQLGYVTLTMRLHASRLCGTQPHFILQQFRHGCHPLLIFLRCYFIHVFRLMIAVFLCTEHFQIMPELARGIGILLIQLLALLIERRFSLQLIIPVLTYLQPLIVAIE